MRANQKGFSLVELMVVIAIIGIVCAFGSANLVAGLPKYRIKKAATDLSAKMRKARSIAVKKRRTISVIFDVGNGRYRIDGVDFPEGSSLTQHYSSGVRFGFGDATGNCADDLGPESGAVSFTNTRLSFNSVGIINNNNTGFIYLENNQGKAYAVGVRSPTGTILVRHWTGAAWE